MSPGARVLGGGWIAVAARDREHQLSLRVEERHDGRLHIVGLLLVDPSGLSGAMLRNLPLGAWEAQMNAPEIATLLRSHLAADGPYGVEDLADEHGWSVADSLIPHDADSCGLEFSFPSEAVTPAVAIAVEPELRLDAPAGRGKRPDAFYRAVAEAYSWLAGHVRRPAVELAAINEVPPSTIHRWVKEARRRGLLGPGRRVVFYDPASPEVLEWARRAREGSVSAWDLAHDPILRAWSSRIRRGALSTAESTLDPLLGAVWERLYRDDISPEEKHGDPLIKLYLESPSPWRDQTTNSDTSDDAAPKADADSRSETS